jgi:hypothetical protein
MSARFRSLDEWRAALLSLPDNAYFDLMRSIFGNIKTPFNKQRLMDELSALLCREDMRKTLGAYIDERDHRIIAATALLEEPAPGEMENFFAGEFSYAELHALLLNLEERFILYRFREEGVFRLALNPALEPVLAPLAANQGVLFPSRPLEEPPLGASKNEVFDDRNLAAFLAFVYGEGDFFRAGSGIRKKVLDAGKAFFPGDLLPSLIRSFLFLGLLERREEELRVLESRLRLFAALAPRERREYCAAGLYLHRESSGNLPEGEENLGASSFLQRNRVRSLASLIHRFLGRVDPRRAYERPVLKRMIQALEREESRGPASPGPKGPVRPDLLLPALEEAGLLIPSGDALTRAPLPGEAGREAAPAGDPGLRAKAGPRALAMDTPLSCILYPEISFTDALSLARFCSLRETGAALRFELTRSSVVRGFDRGLHAEFMVKLLSRLSGDRLDENLNWTLRDWENRYDAVSLYRGLVLTLAEDRRYLAEAEPLASLIRLTLAPGVYLLSAGESSGALEALKRAGVDIVARREEPENAGAPFQAGFRESLSPMFPPLMDQPSPDPVPAPGEAPRGPETREAPGTAHGGTAPQGADPGGEAPWAADPQEGEALKERFRAALERLSIPKQEKDELAARIERRLVLQESQLEGAVIRYEKLEARGLDYVGKAAIAKQAITGKGLIEVIWARPGGGSGQVLGVPTALTKQEGESILVLSPLPEGEELRLPLGKISLLRRVKQSIFEG